MGSHATFNQTHRSMENTIFAVTLIAATVSFALCYAATMMDRSPILAIAAASANAMACMMSDNQEKQGFARIATIVGLALLAASIVMML